MNNSHFPFVLFLRIMSPQAVVWGFMESLLLGFDVR